MSVNLARNVALRTGKTTGARWVLPMDGNCFVTQVRIALARCSLFGK